MTPPSTATAVSVLAPETLRTWIAEHQDLVVIDVRSAAEFEAMHIWGALAMAFTYGVGLLLGTTGIA